MKENIREYAFNTFVKMLPLIVSALFIFFEHTIISYDNSNISPQLGLSCVFFWLFNRPDMFGVFSVVFLGLLSDVLNYTPLGANLFSFLLMYVSEQKISSYISNKLFAVNLTSFAALSFVILATQWGILSVYYGELLPFWGIFFSWMLTVCFYPLVVRINLYVSEKFEMEGFE